VYGREYIFIFLLVVGSLSLLPLLGSQSPQKVTSTPKPELTNTQQLISSPTLVLEVGITPSPFPIQTKSATGIPTSLPTEITDAKGALMVLVPAGEFIMGSNNGSVDEQPTHVVDLDAFYMDKYEVTNRLYRVCVDVAICLPLENRSSATHTRYYSNSEYDNFPVIFVNWNMAQSYCEWRGARLPTEAEWEKAARGNSNFTYPWGEVVNCDHANYGKCNGDVVSVNVYDSGKSMYGIYNMAGNVWEWTNDWYSEVYYQNSLLDNPQGPDNGKQKVLRGGSWSDNNSEVRSANRYAEVPTNFNGFVGFRCVANVIP